MAFDAKGRTQLPGLAPDVTGTGAGALALRDAANLSALSGGEKAAWRTAIGALGTDLATLSDTATPLGKRWRTNRAAGATAADWGVEFQVDGVAKARSYVDDATGLHWTAEAAHMRLNPVAGALEPHTAAGLDLGASNRPWDTMFADNITLGLLNQGARIEIIHTPNPLDYSNSTAAMVVQFKDTTDRGNEVQVPGFVFDSVFDNDGYVIPVSSYSGTIWQNFFVAFKKYGDASAHGFTVTGELHPYGAVGYNEAGAFQYELTNVGSLLGTMSGLEGICSDSPTRSNATSYDTKMYGVISRMFKFNATTRESCNFLVTSEGDEAIDAVLRIQASGGSRKWKYGLDLRYGDFTTGLFALAPNNKALGWLDSGGTERTIMSVSAANETYLRPASGAAYVAIQSFAGTNQMYVDGNTNDALVARIGGSLVRLGKGPDGAAPGPGYACVIIPT